MKSGDAKMPKQSQESESLVRRLAGASVTKAGLALDQTEINRIISEASKGSKFYENEKRKDKELTERVNRILKERDDALQGVNIHKIEAAVDELILKLEADRDLSQFIVHVDMDAFFANVEELRDPSLKGKPFAVGGGVLSTASYEARKYGCRSGMAGFIAKKLCPALVFVGSHYGLYSETSSKIMAILRRYDPTMCPAGVDEAYLNITDYCHEHGKMAEDVVAELRQVVFDETQLTASAGIAPNKMLAKIFSDMNKPNGQFKLEFDQESIKKFMHNLSIRKVPGIGRVNERVLDSIGIQKCGDIFTHRGIISLMDKQFGSIFLLRTYLGIASNHVEPHAREERKSIGAERTFSTLDSNHTNPKKGTEAILAKLEEVAAELEEDMEREGWVGKTVTLKYKLDTYQVFTRAKSFSRSIIKKEELLSTGKDLLLPEFPLRLRLIGLRVTKLRDLRAESKPTGIKRFFEPVKQADGESPRKRRRLNDMTETDDEEAQEGEELDTMPGYHEDEEDDIPLSQRHAEELEEEGLVTAENRDKVTQSSSSTSRRDTNRPRPPISAPASSASTVPLAQGKSLPSRGKSVGPTKSGKNTDPIAQVAPREVTETLLECPICGKGMQTDNQGLNSHIDFCLSRGAIWDAQGETVGASMGTSSSSGKIKMRGEGHNPAESSKPTNGKGKKGVSKTFASSKEQGMLSWVKMDGGKKK